MLNHFDIDHIILSTLKEDIPLGDITTDSLIDESATTQALLIAKQTGVVAGLDVSERAFKLLDPNIQFHRNVKDGDVIQSGDTIAQVSGSTRAMLKAERTALNFLQRLSGVATKTREFCEKVKEFPVRIVDTRKTTPGLRFLEKYAVRVGGGSNHRFCLSDGVLIKDNHIKAAGGIQEAVLRARKSVPHTIKIEIEVESLDQVRQALESKADIIMLDNMSLENMKEAVQMINHQSIVEASGNVDLERVYAIASTGVDIISVGALTHSVEAFDISMKIV